MSTLSRHVAQIEAEFGAEVAAAWRKYHVWAQVTRFVTGVVVSVVWSIRSGLGDWTDVVPLVWGAMWVTAAQMWPQVPWKLLRGRLGAAPQAPESVPPGSI